MLSSLLTLAAVFSSSVGLYLFTDIFNTIKASLALIASSLFTSPNLMIIIGSSVEGIDEVSLGMEETSEGITGLDEVSGREETAGIDDTGTDDTETDDTGTEDVGTEDVEG